MTVQDRASNLDRNYCQRCGAEISSAVHSGDDGCMCDVESGGEMLRCCSRCHDSSHVKTSTGQGRGTPADNSVVVIDTGKGRDALYDLIVEEFLEPEDLASMLCKWMTDDDAMAMLDANELSPRFKAQMEEEESS
jgi:hypothetical protein